MRLTDYVIKNKNKVFIFTLILLSIVLFTFRLGSYSLWDNDEPLYSQMAREFNYHPDFLTLTWCAKPWFCHPPLYMWTTYISGNLLGWNEFAVRIPSAIFSVLIILLTYFLAKRIYNENIAFIASLILMTSLQFFIQARLANLDTMFTFFIMAAVYAGYNALKEHHAVVIHVYIFIFWLMCALGTLTKGPFALCLPFAIIILYLAFTKRLNLLKTFFTFDGVLLYIIFGGFWYFAGLLKYKGEFYNLVFKYFTFGRVISPVMDQSGPIYYYFIVFAAGFLPWTAFFIPAIADFFRDFKKGKNIFFLSWILFTFAFFTLVQTKLPNYILIMYPACAIMLADYFYRNIYENYLKNKLLIPLIFTSIFYIAVIFVFIILAGKRYPVEFLENKIYLMPLLYIISAILLFGWGYFLFGNKKYVIPTFIAGSLILYIFMVNLAVSVDRYKPIKPLALKLKVIKAPSDKTMVFIKHFNGSASLVFYLNEKVTFFDRLSDAETFLKNNDNVYILLKTNQSKIMTDKFKLIHEFDYDKYSVYRKL